MEKAILIMAHKNEKQLIRLLKQLNCKEFFVYIHIDKKWKEFSFQDFRKKLEKEEIHNVSLIPKQISACLDNYSLIKITLELLKTAVSDEEHRFNYYILISGQDYPIKSMSYINEFLDAGYPKPYIDCVRYDDGKWMQKRFQKLQFRHIHKVIRNTFQNKYIRRVAKSPIYVFELLLSVFTTPYKQLRKSGINIVGGAEWWILPDIIVNEIIKEVENNPKYLKWLRNTATCDETFIQILVMNSKYNNLVELHPASVREQYCLNYSHYYVDGRPKTGHPFIIETKDFKRLKSLPHLFARKFDTDIDGNILDLIDSEILTGDN